MHMSGYWLVNAGHQGRAWDETRTRGGYDTRTRGGHQGRAWDETRTRAGYETRTRGGYQGRAWDDTSRSEVFTRLSRCLLLQNHTRTTSLSKRRLAARYAIWDDDGFGWDWKWSSSESLALRPIVVLRLRLRSNDSATIATYVTVNTMRRLQRSGPLWFVVWPTTSYTLIDMICLYVQASTKTHEQY